MATVSHVINGTRKVAPDTAARVRRAMEELAYQPNAVEVAPVQWAVYRLTAQLSA